MAPETLTPKIRASRKTDKPALFYDGRILKFIYQSETNRNGFAFAIGIDEAGRGPLAGPVTAAAVLLKETDFENRIDDSKRLTPAERVNAFHEIYSKAYVGVGVMSEAVIDRNNILEATYLAMHNAIVDLVENHPESANESFMQNVFLLVDGIRFKSELPYSYKAIVDGDQHVLSIACASIVAKVLRDRILETYHKIYPQYGFKSHKGYCTLEHRRAIRRHGLCLIHRKSFSYV
jgi:ribonuclease HII